MTFITDSGGVTTEMREAHEVTDAEIAEIAKASVMPASVSYWDIVNAAEEPLPEDVMGDDEFNKVLRRVAALLTEQGYNVSTGGYL